jgi:hypothetical protein
VRALKLIIMPPFVIGVGCPARTNSNGAVYFLILKRGEDSEARHGASETNESTTRPIK